MDDEGAPVFMGRDDDNEVPQEVSVTSEEAGRGLTSASQLMPDNGQASNLYVDYVGIAEHSKKGKDEVGEFTEAEV